MRPSTCQKSEQLSQYLDGTLPDDLYGAIEQHLAECETCVCALSELETAEISFTDIRQLTQEGFEAEFACKESLQRIKELSVCHFSKDANRAFGIQHETPDAIRDYEISGVLGTGGMGTVFDATHRRLHRRVALKVLAANRIGDTDSERRFEREMQLVGKVRHRNVVNALDAGQFEGTHYLVMEFVSGNDLGRILRQSGPLSIADACEIGRQAAEGLRCIHDHGMVHRDIKPSNLMLTNEEGAPVVKLLDLGLARLQQSAGDDLTAADQLMGTLDYMAPEQTHASRLVDARADIYSLGATLYKLLSGRAPFEASEYDSSVKKLRALDSDEPPPLSALREEIPPALSQLVHRMLAKDPDDRPENASTVLEALQPFTDTHGLAAIVERIDAANTVDRTSDTSRDSIQATVEMARRSDGPNGLRRRWPIVALLLFAVALAAGIIMFVRGSDGGVVRIEINDPKMSIEIEGKSYTFANSGEKILVTPGEATLTVRRGDLSFETTHLMVGKGRNPDLRIDYLGKDAEVEFDGRLQRLSATDSSVHSESAADQDLAKRTAAEFLLQEGAKLKVSTDFGTFDVAQESDLPADRFSVLSANCNSLGVFTSDHGDSLAKFSEMEKLVINAREVRQGSTQAMRSLTNLEHVELWGSGFRGERVEFLEYCGQITLLHIFGGFDDASLSYLKNMKYLDWLRINYSEVTGEAFAELSSLTRLTKFDIGDSKLTDEGAKQIAKLPALQDFWAIRTSMGNEGLKHFSGHRSIRRLKLQDTRVTNEGILALHGMPELIELFVLNTLITEEGAKAFQAKHPKCQVVYGPKYARKVLPSQGDQSSLNNVDRQVAAQVLGLGGIVNREREIVDEPNGRFVLDRVYITNLNDDSLAALAPGLQACENLHECSLFGKELTAASLSAIVEIKADEYKIGDIEATEDEFALLRQLERPDQITLVGSSSGDSFLKAVAGIPSLTYIGLEACDVSGDESLQPLVNGPPLDFVFLGAPQFTSAAVDTLSEIQSLERVRLVSKSLDDTIWHRLRELPRLVEITINAEGEANKRRLMGEGVEELAALSQLRSLHIQACQFSDHGMQSLGALTQIEELQFYGVDVQDKHLPYFFGMTNLKNLCFYETQVTEQGLVELKKQLINCEIMH